MAPYECWFDEYNEGHPDGTVEATSARRAAETFVKENDDGDLSDVVTVIVRDGDGERTTVRVTIETRTTYTGREISRSRDLIAQPVRS